MHGDLLDLILIGVAGAFAVSGYRRGVVVGVASLAGFAGGAALGLVIAPALARSVVAGHALQFVLAITVVFVVAMVGQLAASTAGAAMRDLVRWRSATVADSAGGAAVSGLSVLVTGWLVGISVAGSPFPVIVSEVNSSAVLRAVNRVMPATAQTWFSGFRRGLASGSFPQVCGDLSARGIVSLPPPDHAVLTSSGVRRASGSVVKVLGVTAECPRSGGREGSGFVFTPGHVMTNAHVVAGVRGGLLVVDRSRRRWHARVVVYDDKTDIAVLGVPGLGLRPLTFAPRPAHNGGDAVVTGYPRGERFRAAAARAGVTSEARSSDIYGFSEVTRRMYVLRADVEPGDSGGPLLARDGDVYGVVFAAGPPGRGYALTAADVAPDAQAATGATGEVSTRGCG